MINMNNLNKFEPIEVKPVFIKFTISYQKYLKSKKWSF